MTETSLLDAEMSELAKRIAQLTLGLSNKAAWLHIRRLVQAYDPPVPNRDRCAMHAAVWRARKSLRAAAREERQCQRVANYAPAREEV